MSKSTTKPTKPSKAVSPGTMGPKEIATKYGLSYQTVARKIREMLPQVEPGRYDSELVDMVMPELIASIDVGKAMGAAAGGDKDSSLAGLGITPRGENGGKIHARNDASERLALAKIQSEEAKAAKMTLAVEKERGNLIDREAARRAGANFAARVRQALFSVPIRVSTRLIGLQDAASIARIIDDELRDALGTLADLEDIPKHARDQ
ncbi:hypothetical protein E8L99_16545 [Phreatobacter aquaticus]|uniref:Terminase small subunit n=1 Tax=Phreatobacter aquaticus TaxID=2570229 RepID=A0A4D7QKX8_9HYPH|nr:hypothetical protein [Phreatobacter aquaticus]QCK87251.1 hypothetical protein E8L99_16545 [Phreatobacter aquaticus]